MEMATHGKIKSYQNIHFLVQLLQDLFHLKRQNVCNIEKGLCYQCPNYWFSVEEVQSNDLIGPPQHLSPRKIIIKIGNTEELKCKLIEFCCQITTELLFQQYNNQVCMGKLKIWAIEEDEILIRLSTTAKSKKWKRASEELRRMGFDRSDVECRQRYVNHLDPSVNKQGWSDQELQILYSKYSEYGNKWFLLQRHLPGRTQTKIKNYFYGRIRFFLKIIVKNIMRSNTGFIGDIKTDILLDIYEGKNKFEGFTVIQKTIKKLKYKIEKQSCIKLIKENREQFEDFARFFTSHYSNKPLTNTNESLEAIDSSSQSEQQDIQNEGGQPTMVSVVSMLGGVAIQQQAECAYLKRMAELHWQHYQYYQAAYLSLQQPQQMPSF